jgi:hypothetical protein
MIHTDEDDEFARIEMEQRIRARQQEMFGIPFVTAEELEKLLKEYADEVQTPSNPQSVAGVRGRHDSK